MSAKRTMSFNHRAKKFLKARGTCAGALIGFRNEQAERSSGVLQPRESRRAFAPRLIAAQRLQHLLARAHFQPPNAPPISRRRQRPRALMVNEIDEHRVWQVAFQVVPGGAKIARHVDASIVGHENRLRFVRRNHRGVMRNVRQPAAIDVVPVRAAVIGAKDMRVAEIRDCGEQNIGIRGTRFQTGDCHAGQFRPAMLGLQVFPPSRLRKNPPFSVPI